MESLERTPDLPGGGRPGPFAAPMASPEDKEGDLAFATLDVRAALAVLHKALTRVDPESKHGRALIDAQEKLIRAFGDDTTDLSAVQMKDLFNALAQTPGGSPVQEQLKRAMQPPAPPQMGRPPMPPQAAMSQPQPQ